MNQDIKSSLDHYLGKELIQVCIGKYQLILNFENDISISVESKMLFNEHIWIPDSSSLPYDLLIGFTITSIKISEVEELEIISKDSSIRILKNAEGFESYQISTPNGLVVF